MWFFSMLLEKNDDWWFLHSRSQISHPQSYKKEKLPRLSLSQRSSKNGVPLSQHRKIRRVKNKPKVISPSKFFSCSTPIKEKKKTIQSFVKEDSFWTHEQKLNCEVCSICMMPWIAYECNGKSREFHIDECLDVDFSVKAGTVMINIINLFSN